MTNLKLKMSERAREILQQVEGKAHLVKTTIGSG